MIELVVVISLFIFGVHKAVNDEQMILHYLVKYLEKLPTWLRMPLYECSICMSSFYSIVFWIFYDFNLVITIFCVAGLNTLLNYFYEL